MLKHKNVTKPGEPVALALLSQNPELSALNARLTEIKVEAQKKIAELQAMADRIGKSVDEQNAEIWKEVENKIQALLPLDYSRKRHNLAFRAGVLFLEPVEEKCDCLACKMGIS